MLGVSAELEILIETNNEMSAKLMFARCLIN